MIKKQIGRCTLYFGKCEDILPKIETQSIDSVITDPPYQYLKHKLDTSFDEGFVFSQWHRVLKNNSLIAFFGRGNSFFRWNIALEKLGFHFKETAVWEKENASNFLNNFLRIHEDICFRAKGNRSLNKCYIDYFEYQLSIGKLERLRDLFFKLKSAMQGRDKDKVIKYIETGCVEFGKPGKTKYEITAGKHKVHSSSICSFQTIAKGKIETSIMRCKREQFEYEHPTQKPVELMKRIINLATNENDTVLDTFMGGGSTGVAAVQSGRNFIGIECDKEYFDTACKRIENACNNTVFENKNAA